MFLDLVALTQTSNLVELRNNSRALYHAIHHAFLPTNLIGHNGGDSVSEKKLKAREGERDVRKEILRWLFNGTDRRLAFPDTKVQSLWEELK